ncbi:MAG: DNA polymerase III subunit delta [Oscillospiraceae bacterium]
MAKKEDKLNYNALRAGLLKNGPGRLYFLYGPEDYLRELFLEELKKLCVPGGASDFGYRRLNGPALDLRELSGAVNSLPFMSERTLVEIHGFDLNKCREAEADELEKILSDLPDYCTVVFVPAAEYEPDWRLRAGKSIKKHGEAIKFTSQEQGQLITWIKRRFAALGKTADNAAATSLIFLSGDIMSGLIPEIEKIAASVQGDSVSAAEVERYAHHLPEAKVFELTDRMSARDWDGAAALLAELLTAGEEPIRTLAAVGQQLRRLYAARLAIDQKLGAAYVSKTCGIKFDFITDKLMRAARGFTQSQLRRAVALCAETDYAMKSSSEDNVDLMKTLLLRLAVAEVE